MKTCKQLNEFFQSKRTQILLPIRHAMPLQNINSQEHPKESDIKRLDI
jgi:hypothetical protein